MTRGTGRLTSILELPQAIHFRSPKAKLGLSSLSSHAYKRSPFGIRNTPINVLKQTATLRFQRLDGGNQVLAIVQPHLRRLRTNPGLRRAVRRRDPSDASPNLLCDFFHDVR